MTKSACPRPLVAQPDGYQSLRVSIVAGRTCRKGPKRPVLRAASPNLDVDTLMILAGDEKVRCM